MTTAAANWAYSHGRGGLLTEKIITTGIVMTTASMQQQMSEAELKKFARLIYDTTGIVVSSQKRLLLSNRIRRRLRITETVSYDDYLRLLKKCQPGDDEWRAFLQEVTTHETYLFRDEAHWDWFQQDYLPSCVHAVRKGHKERRLRIWSAACSTGDEAYTIAACIADTISDHSQWNISIVGTDIGTDSLERARQPSFSKRSMGNVPHSIRKRFFRGPDAQGEHQPVNQLRSWTSFQYHNLLNAFKAEPFDVIFLKNVLIYFDQTSKKLALTGIANALKPGGVLITGASEGISALTDGLERLRPWIHRRPV